jgi:hypothetical protein
MNCKLATLTADWKARGERAEILMSQTNAHTKPYSKTVHIPGASVLLWTRLQFLNIIYGFGKMLLFATQQIYDRKPNYSLILENGIKALVHNASVKKVKELW